MGVRGARLGHGQAEPAGAQLHALVVLGEAGCAGSCGADAARLLAGYHAGGVVGVGGVDRVPRPAVADPSVGRVGVHAGRVQPGRGRVHLVLEEVGAAACDLEAGVLRGAQHALRGLLVVHRVGVRAAVLRVGRAVAADEVLGAGGHVGEVAVRFGAEERGGDLWRLLRAPSTCG